ncbi:MAG: hypothetical protein R3275_05375, partial [Saprospiraceae bacterium]|nr:hypothetical protein [Saprospiraceae bacterium]
MKSVFNLFVLFLALGLTVACSNDKSTAEEGGEEESTVATNENASGDQASLNQANDPAEPAGPTTTIEYAETTHDFG